ncbi:MAG: RluA family pseudouridine synthase [Treponema sp.]|nr:RluA family pseudouridine synthase [Candidatus Treponema merdequi]
MTVITLTPDRKIRLDILLRENLGKELNLEISNSKIRRLIMAGCVRVNAKEVRVPSYTVFEASRVDVSVDKEKLLYEKEADDIKFDVTPESVLYEDAYLIFIDKPSRFPTEKTIVDSRDNLHDAVVRYLWSKNPSLRNPPYVGIMHRLDKDTSGVILFTKKREVNKAVFDMFDSGKLKIDGCSSDKKSSSGICNAINSGLTSSTPQTEISHNTRPITKTYIAVVKDCAKIKDSFVVKNFLGRITSKSSGAKWGEVPESRGGVIAVTEFKVRKREKGMCFIECHPVTGRTHQIRVHLAGIGCPILGDKIYGDLRDGAERLMLHAESLEIVHPVSGERLCVKSERGI